MSASVIWLISTAVLWMICTAAFTVIEALVHGYLTRFATMIVAGIVIGALASAFGYTFHILALILFAQLIVMRRRLRGALDAERTASKYIAPSMALVVAATLGSYIFSIEVCEGSYPCRRVFFERIYTPPHLRLPDVAEFSSNLPSPVRVLAVSQ